MDEKKFASLVHSLETSAAKNPGAYKFRVGLLGALGYIYLLLIVSLLLGIVAAVLYLFVYSGHFNAVLLKVLWIPLVLVGIVLRSLWIALPVPDGTELQREQAPALFDLSIPVLTLRWGAPPRTTNVSHKKAQKAHKE